MNTDSETKTLFVAGGCFLLIAIITGVAYLSDRLNPNARFEHNTIILDTNHVIHPQSNRLFLSPYRRGPTNMAFLYKTNSYWQERVKPSTNHHEDLH